MPPPEQSRRVSAARHGMTTALDHDRHRHATSAGLFANVQLLPAEGRRLC